MTLPTLFSKEFMGTVSLLCLLLMSAVAVVYVSHLNRHAFSQFQAALQKRDRLDIEWGSCCWSKARRHNTPEWSKSPENVWQ